MKEKFQSIGVVKNEEEKRFELTVDGHTAFIEYNEFGNQTTLVHTEAPEELKGTGAAGALVEKTLQYFIDGGKQILPFCPYIFSYIKRHPEWKKVVDRRFKKYDEL